MRIPSKLPVLGVLSALSVLTIEASPQRTSAAPEPLAIPSAVHSEHRQLRDDVARAITDQGAIGDAARTLERALAPHLKHEEEVVLLPLGALRPVVDGEPIADAARVLAVVAQVERELPRLVQEHRAILDATKRLEDAARREGKPQYQSLADRVRLHVVLEDEVLYRASILVGRYLQMKGPVTAAAPAPAPGRELFRINCASCHGQSARGNGPVAIFLRKPPADLTQIARRHKGIFPKEEIARIIDGRRAVKTHGDSQMPVWGDALARSIGGADDKAVADRIRALVDYLETIQERPSE